MLFCTFAAVLLTCCQDPGAAMTDVAGRVEDVHGEPVPAAEVWLTPLAEPGRELARGRTDASGEFRLRAPGVALLAHAWAAGKAHAAVDVPIWPDPDCAVCVVRLVDAGTITGAVVDAGGKPVAGALVRSEFVHSILGSEAPLPSAVTDGDGRFELARQPVGYQRVSAVHGSGTAASWLWLHDRSEVRLQLADAGPPIRVRVLDLPPAALPSCALHLGGPAFETSLQLADNWTRTTVWHPPYQLQRPPTGGDTFVLLGLGRCEVELKIGGDGALLTPFRMHLAADDVQRDLEVQAVELPPEPLPPWTLLRGRLCDDAGEPLAGQQIVGRGQGRRVTATTAADGTFALPHLCREGERVSLQLRGPDWLIVPDDRRERCRVGANVVAKPGVEHVLRATVRASVRGRLVDAGGGAAAGVAVSLAHREAGASPDYATRTASDGSFAFEALRGCGCELELSAWGGGGQLQKTIAVRAGQQLDLGELRLHALAAIAGQVRCGDGGPAGNVHLVVQPLRPDGQLAVDGAASHCGQAWTSRDGAYRLRGLLPGDYAVSVSACRGDQKAVTRRLKLTLGATAQLDFVLPY